MSESELSLLLSYADKRRWEYDADEDFRYDHEDLEYIKRTTAF